jgi:prepilin-type N-terminal cleavage/methylation domain-containing protein
MRAAVRRRIATVCGDDSGFSMIEVVVVMVIMSIVLIIFTTGVTQAFSAESKVDTASSAEGQLLTAFQRLDKEVRYSSGISSPGTQAGDPVVEFLSVFSGTAICTEVRLHTSTQQLQQRTWTQNTTPLVPGAWQQLAFNVSAATPTTTGSTIVTVAPFATIGADSTFQFQRLEIAMSSKFGSNANATTKQSDITFTALNTTSATSSSTTCTEGRGVAW